MEKTIGLSVYATIDFGDTEAFVKTYPLEKVFNKWMSDTLALGDYKKLGDMFEQTTGMKIPEFFTVAVADKTTSKDDKAEKEAHEAKAKAKSK